MALIDNLISIHSPSTAPGLRDGPSFRERSLRGVVVTVVLGLDFCCGSVGQRGAQPRVAEPAEHGELEVVGALPRSFSVDGFGLVEAVHDLGQSVDARGYLMLLSSVYRPPVRGGAGA
jgi:hypothetical protein